MFYDDALGGIALFSLVGVVLSIVLATIYETKRPRDVLPPGEQFRKRLLLYLVVAIFGCGIATAGWLLFSIVDWVTG